MRRRLWMSTFLVCVLASAVADLSGAERSDLPTGAKAANASAASPYVERTPTRGGTGRVYMGREISHVMGHLGADWLERATRVREERTDLLIERLPLDPDDVVVDLGAGTGYFSLPIAKRVPKGRVLAVDLQPEMLEFVRRASAREGVDNIEPILATESDPRIPEATADLVLIVDAYHEFSHPREVGLAIVRGLRPGGRLVLVEYRGEDPSVPIKRLHKMTAKQAIQEIEAIGLEWEETLDFLPIQHVLVFRKKE
ncbi:MAG: methyltransferase domain-containing protein [Myxococcota bacterium]